MPTAFAMFRWRRIFCSLVPVTETFLPNNERHLLQAQKVGLYESKRKCVSFLEQCETDLLRPRVSNTRVFACACVCVWNAHCLKFSILICCLFIRCFTII